MAERPELLVSPPSSSAPPPPPPPPPPPRDFQEEHKQQQNDIHVLMQNEEGEVDNGDTTAAKKDEEDEMMMLPALPLTDGCDLEEWRRQKLVDCPSDEVTSVLNVGQGSYLLRRERQIPLPSSRSFRQWNELRARLLQIPAHQQEPPRIQYASSSSSSSSSSSITSSLHPWFEKDNTVAILEGCADTWTAMESCRFERLVERFGHLQWRFSDTHGETMSLRTYQKYIDSIEGQLDDAPLAVYDSQFALDERCQILSEYSVPSCFDTDLFELLDDDNESENENSHRPPYRWILIGPARSGTGLHVDPVGTHAWVTLLQGLKRWVLFPPSTCRASIGMETPYQIPSSIWFRDYYDKVMAAGGQSCSNNAIHVLQRPGETVYVPAGWPHLVLNLELSVAITHNYATQYPSPQRLWQAVNEAEPELALQFAAKLQKHHPELYTSMTM